MKTKLLKITVFGLASGIALIGFLTFFKVEVTGYMLASLLYAGIFILNETTFQKNTRRKEKEYLAIDNFFSDVRRRFYAHGMVDEAVFDAAFGLPKGFMKENADEIADVLSGGNIRTSAEAYRRKQENRYLKLFLTLCITVIEYGDRKVNGQSLFLTNLLNLKNELRTELDEDSKLRSRMSGMGFVSVVPVLFLGVIERWGSANLPQLEAFYSGTAGITLKATLFVMSVMIYSVLCILRGMIKDSRIAITCLKRFSGRRRTGIFLRKVELRFGKTSKKLSRLIYESGENIELRELYLAKILLFLTCLSVLLATRLLGMFFGEKGIHLALIFLISFIALFIPEILLLVKRFVNRIRMEEEVLQFQSVVTMLMFVEQLSVFDILTELEQFAEIFRRSISNCLNDFHSGEEKALEEMRNREGCEAFRRLADGFISSDRIGVRQAFDEIDSDRAFYIRKRETENQRSITNRAVLGKFLAFIPLVLIIALYLIVPFAKESISMLSEISAEFIM